MNFGLWPVTLCRLGALKKKALQQESLLFLNPVAISMVRR